MLPDHPRLTLIGATLLLVALPLPRLSADDAKAKAKAKPGAKPQTSAAEKDLPTYDLLDAMGKGVVGVEAEGIGDGRMTVSVSNRTNGQLRVVLPPGLVAQGASGQMGGMGGMGGGGMGGGGKGGGGVGGGGGGGRGGGGKD